MKKIAWDIHSLPMINFFKDIWHVFKESIKSAVIGLVGVIGILFFRITASFVIRITGQEENLSYVIDAIEIIHEVTVIVTILCMSINFLWRYIIYLIKKD